MDKTKKLKTGNENSIIIIILAALLVVVIAIVGVYVGKNNKGIASFDGGKVTKNEYKIYYQMFSSYLQMYGYQASDIPYEILLKAAQDKMILSDAKKAGVTLTDDDKASLDEIFNDESYIDYFKQSGYDIDNLKELYSNDYIVSNYIEKLATEASNEDIENYIKSKYSDGEEVNMDEWDTSRILFSFTDSTTGSTMTDEQKAELKTKAEDVLKRALAGEDFAELAKEFSDDSTKENGGKYAMYDDGNTVEQYVEAVKKLKDGEICAELVETAYGYHIIKLNAKNEGGRVNSESERQEYVNTLFENIEETRNFVVDKDAFKAFVMELAPETYTSADQISGGPDDPATSTTDSTDSTQVVDGDDQTITVGE